MIELLCRANIIQLEMNEVIIIFEFWNGILNDDGEATEKKTSIFTSEQLLNCSSRTIEQHISILWIFIFIDS
jgi:hypothetical protein